MSVAVTAIVAANSSVMQPVAAMINSTSGVKKGKNLATRYTPAATIVAECTRAESVGRAQCVVVSRCWFERHGRGGGGVLVVFVFVGVFVAVRYVVPRRSHQA